MKYKRNKDLFFWFVIFANIFGAIYGLTFYYWDRIASTSFPLVLFVPDCPLYVSLFVISALLVKYKVKSWISDLFIFVSSVGLMKYTLWTMFVILFFNSYFLSSEVILLYVGLFIVHLLALLEVFTFIGKIDAKLFFIPIAIIWLVINDAVDYGLGTHPTLPAMDMGQFTALISVTVLLSLLCSIAYYFILRSKIRAFTKLVFDN